MRSDVMRLTQHLVLSMLIACFATPSLADEPSAADPVDSGAELEESLERLRDQLNRKLGELAERKLAELEAREADRQRAQLAWGYVPAASRQTEVIVIHPSRASSADSLEAVARRAP